MIYLNSKSILQLAAINDIMCRTAADAPSNHIAENLKSEYGGERLRPDEGESRCMSRTPVGLANHPAITLIGNYQLQMAA
jgi:hypothetical protein